MDSPSGSPPPSLLVQRRGTKRKAKSAWFPADTGLPAGKAFKPAAALFTARYRAALLFLFFVFGHRASVSPASRIPIALFCGSQPPLLIQIIGIPTRRHP